MKNMINKAFCEDNLSFLKKLHSNMFDMIYIDPQYYSNREFKDFDDRWKNIDEYIDFMKPRFKQIYRVLKDTGIFLIQGDQNAIFENKVLLDSIFGKKNFIICIIWQRSNPHHISKLDINNDFLLVYSKSNIYNINPQYRNSTNKEKKRYDKYDAKMGKRYLLSNVEFSGTENYYNKNQYRIYRGKKYYTKQGWKWTQKTLDKRVKQYDELGTDYIHVTKSNRLFYKVFDTGLKKITNIWMDISKQTSDQIDYSTQKPKKLMYRIIEMFSNTGDLIGDFFCGSGSTLVYSKELRRNFIGCDINPNAIKLTKERLRLILKYKGARKL